jgi:ABC-2 type transport system ATP-binding protein
MTHVIETERLTKSYGTHRGIIELDLAVEEGEAFGFLGPNGAGKTTTIRTLLDHIRPTSGKARIFGIDTHQDPISIHARLGYLPGEFVLYDKLTGGQTIEYFANLRGNVDAAYQAQLVERLDIDPSRKFREYSKGNKQKIGLVIALQHQPELLVLDEPTSGLDPIVRREFIQTVIGAYQESAPGKRTVFVSTHLIAEFEGLIDQFTIIDRGRDVLTLDADVARERYQKVYARFAGPAPRLDLGGARVLRQQNRELEVLVNGNATDVVERLRAGSPETIETEALTLEEIFVTSLAQEGAAS